MTLNDAVAQQLATTLLIQGNALFIDGCKCLPRDVADGVRQTRNLVFGDGRHPRRGKDCEGRDAKREHEVDHRLAHSNDRLEVVLQGFLGHLLDGGLAEALGGIGGSHVGIRQLHDTEQAIAKTVMFLLNDVGQITRVALVVNPVAKPKTHENKDSACHQPKEGKTDDLGHLSGEVGDKENVESQERAKQHTGHRDDGVNHEEAALELAKLVAQRVRKFDRDRFGFFHNAPLFFKALIRRQGTPRCSA